MTTNVVVQGVFMSSFEKILLRLKERLGVQTDKEVAAALGLSIKAFTARKMRGAFPEDKLRLLASERPELDVDYILVGRQDVHAAALSQVDESVSPGQSELDKTTYGMSRYERADVIIADYERQHDFKLPLPWRTTVSRLLFHGLSDPDLHLIFDTLKRVEFEVGRLEPKPVDYSTFAEDK